jgi:hypothetical protein
MRLDQLRSRVGFRFECCGCKPPIEVAPTGERPPIVQENFERAPIRHPAQNEKALLDEALKRRFDQVAGHEMRGGKARDQNQHADRKRTASDPEQLIEVALQTVGPMGEESAKRFAKLPRRLALVFGLRKVNDDLDRLVGGQFPCPSDDVFLRFLVEVSFSKRKRIEGVEKLCDILDADLDHLVCACGRHI